MDISTLLQNNHVSLQVTPADLHDFGRQLIAATMQEMAEAEASASDERITAQAAAERLGVSGGTLWRWAKSGYLTPTRVGRRVYYRVGDIEALAGKQGRA
jgi:excisionase family DNA binding protein